MTAVIDTKYVGRLGNQLFQAATLLSLQWDHKYKVYFPYNKYPFINILFKDSKDVLKRDNFKVIKDNQDQTYQSTHISTYIPLELDGKEQKDLLLSGYFQSYKYFHHHRDKLIKLFRPKVPSIDKVYNQLANNNKTVAIHIRRTDYTQLSQYYHQLSQNYYVKSISNFDYKCLFLVFSDDIEWCKGLSIFKNINVKYVDFELDSFRNYTQDYLHMLLMAKCDSFIIANSTFSWWASYLSDCKDKIVYAPREHFGPALHHITLDDYYPENYIRLLDNNNIIRDRLGFDFHTFCVTLRTDYKRQEESRKQADLLGLPMEFYYVDRHPNDPVIGCRESHLRVLLESSKRGYKHTLILEDDFYYDMTNLNKLCKFNQVDDYDILFLGCTLLNGFQIDPNYIKVNLAYCTHAYFVSSECIRVILSQVDFNNGINCKWLGTERHNEVKKKDTQHHAIDVYYSNWICHDRKKSYCVNPLAVYQRACMSNITGKFEDYRSWQDSLIGKVNNDYDSKCIKEHNNVFDDICSKVKLEYKSANTDKAIELFKTLLNPKYINHLNNLRINAKTLGLTNELNQMIPLVIVIAEKHDIKGIYNIKHRLSSHNLDHDLHFVYSINHNVPSDEFSTFIHGCKLNEEEKHYAAIYLDHLRAFRHLVQSSKNGAYVMESDAMLIKDFLNRSQLQIKDNDLVLFSPYCSVKPLLANIKNSLFRPYTGVYSTCCYWISRNKAIELLKIYDKPLCLRPERQGRISPEELIVSHSTTWCSWPPLAIEDCITTNIQSNMHLLGKRSYWSSFGIENYQIPNEDVRKQWL